MCVYTHTLVLLNDYNDVWFINVYQCLLTLDLHTILTPSATCLNLCMRSRELKAESREESGQLAEGLAARDKTELGESLGTGQSSAFTFTDGKVTWLRCQGGAGLGPSPLDFTYNCACSPTAYFRTDVIVTRDADRVSLRKQLIMFKILCSENSETCPVCSQT